MYQITCDTCGDIGFHPSRLGAESRARTHCADTGHECSVSPMQSV